MIKVDIMRRLDPEMAAALNQTRRLDMDLIAKRGGPIAPGDLAGQRAAYDHERAFWNEIKPALPAVEAVEIPPAPIWRSRAACSSTPPSARR